MTLLAGLFTFASTSSVNAQGLIINNTDCELSIKVRFGSLNCVSQGTVGVVTPPNGLTPIPIPVGTSIIEAKGLYSGGNFIGGICLFNIGIACSGLSTSDAVSCQEACLDYTADLVGNVIIISN